MLGLDIFKTLTNKYDIAGVDLSASIHIPEEKQIIGDLTDPDFLSKILVDVVPDIIIHCAAIVNLKLCEEEKGLTDRLHLDVTAQLAANGSKIVFISTDSVFDGKRGNYVESDPISPLNYYGESKWKGEELVRKNPDHLILRTNIFGFNCPLKSSLAEWALRSFQDEANISGFTDVYFNSIYTKHLAVIIGELLTRDITGTLHAASGNFLSKYSFLKYLESRYSGKLGLVERAESRDTVIFPDRPANPTLNVDRLKQFVDVPTIESGIDALIEDYLEVRDECNQTG